MNGQATDAVPDSCDPLVVRAPAEQDEEQYRRNVSRGRDKKDGPRRGSVSSLDRWTMSRSGALCGAHSASLSPEPASDRQTLGQRPHGALGNRSRVADSYMRWSEGRPRSGSGRRRRAAWAWRGAGGGG
jgi:hypothetical protein